MGKIAKASGKTARSTGADATIQAVQNVLNVPFGLLPVA
jgi:hypothetical protein